MASEYWIGTTAANFAPIDALFYSKKDQEPRGDPMDYSKPVTLGDGTVRGLGWLKQTWFFGALTETYRNRLHAYIGPVYVRTRKNDGTFGHFTAQLVWPEAEPEHYANHVIGLTVELRKLVEYTPE